MAEIEKKPGIEGMLLVRTGPRTIAFVPDTRPASELPTRPTAEVDQEITDDQRALLTKHVITS